MPLHQGKSKKAFNKNVEQEMKSGKPQDQSLAIAYNVMRKNKRKKFAEGGKTSTGGAKTGGAKTSTTGNKTKTGGSNPGGASTGGAGTVTITTRDLGSKGINVSNVGGKTDSKNHGGMDPGDDKDDMMMAKGGRVRYAEGGNVNAKNARRPMPNNRYDDSAMDARNSGNKAPGEDAWTDDPTVRQAQKPSQTKLSRPKLVGSDAFSVRYREEIDKDLDRINAEAPDSDKAQPAESYDEVGANRQGPKVSDMERQHNNKRAPYEMASEHEYSEDMASSNMKKVQSPINKVVKGNPDSINSDLELNEYEDRGGKKEERHLMSRGKRPHFAKGGPVMEPEDHGQELEERDDEAHMQSELAPGEHGEQPASWRDELDADGQNPNDLDMEEQHNSGRRPYYMGGPAVAEDEPHEMFDDSKNNMDSDMELNPAHGKYSKSGGMKQPQPEADIEHEDSLVAAIMAKRDRMHAAIDSGARDLDEAAHMASGGSVVSGSHDMDYADGGDIDPNQEDEHSPEGKERDNTADHPGDSPDEGEEEESMYMARGGKIKSHDSIYSDDSDQADLSRNADEDANEEDQLSFNALEKENYSESEGLELLDSPLDSAQHGDEEEDESEDRNDMVGSIRRKMNVRRQFKQR